MCRRVIFRTSQRSVGDACSRSCWSSPCCATAKAVLLPLALGIVLAFTLTPLVRLFDRMAICRVSPAWR